MAHPTSRMLVILAASLLAYSGCGTADNRVSIEGTVTSPKGALKSGSVTFHDSNGNIQTSEISPEGKYTILADPGTYKVTIYAAEEGADDGEDAYAIKKPLVPEKYLDAQSTPLSVEVKADGTGDYALSVE